MERVPPGFSGVPIGLDDVRHPMQPVEPDISAAEVDELRADFHAPIVAEAIQPDVDSFEVLSPKPGDILIVRLNRAVDPTPMTKALAEKYPAVCVIGLPNDGSGLELLGEAQMGLAGWYRRPSNVIQMCDRRAARIAVGTRIRVVGGTNALNRVGVVRADLGDLVAVLLDGDRDEVTLMRSWLSTDDKAVFDA